MDGDRGGSKEDLHLKLPRSHLMIMLPGRIAVIGCWTGVLSLTLTIQRLASCTDISLHSFNGFFFIDAIFRVDFYMPI